MDSRFDRHEVARTLSKKHRHMFHQLGAAIQSAKSRGFLADANYCHELALIALEAVNWKSMKAAKAMMTVTRMW